MKRNPGINEKQENRPRGNARKSKNQDSDGMERIPAIGELSQKREYD
ncbi:MAG: hypothetical protein K0M40_04590 [Prolixibacteraceae bacterium]|nr:hypothetical protein [Prolixibacteraceae bacterium]